MLCNKFLHKNSDSALCCCICELEDWEKHFRRAPDIPSLISELPSSVDLFDLDSSGMMHVHAVMF